MIARAPIALTPYLLLVRIVLFLAFVISGVQEIGMVDYTGEEANRVRRLESPPESTPRLIDAEATSTASFNGQDDEAYQARALYRIAIRMEDAGWSSPVLLAWIVTLTQLVGGALLLPGLLCRFWGFGLSVVTGAGFVLTSWPLVNTSALTFVKLPPADFNQVMFHLGFFALTLGILVCGGGGISLDRMIFGGNRARMDDLHEIDDFDEE
jgi:uncharacterized membrane protein YphA (DoxX/SURF4 family)